MSQASLYLARWMRLSPYSDLLSQELMEKLQKQGNFSSILGKQHCSDFPRTAAHRPRESRSLDYNLDDMQFDENLWKQLDQGEDLYDRFDDPKQKLIDLFLAATQANPQDPDVLIILGVA